MTELAAVGEELRGRRLLAAAARRLARDRRLVLARHGTESRRTAGCAGSARARTKIAFAVTEPDAGTNTHNISTRATPRRQRRLSCSAARRSFISGVEDAEALFVVARSRRTSGSCGWRCSSSTPTRRASTRTEIPTAPEGRRQAVARCSSTTSRSARTGAWPNGPRRAVRRPEPGADHGRGAAPSARAGSRWRKASAYARERTVWSVPIGAHQGAQPPAGASARSSWSSPR